MDDALSPDQPTGGGGANDHLAGSKGTDDQSAERYAIGARLSASGSVHTFSATDHWLHRPVVVVLDTEFGQTLDTTCQAMAGVTSPYMVDIYDRGSNATGQFVVCEHPMSTVASLVQESGQSLWNEGWAIDTAKQLAIAMYDFRSSGVETGRLHFGHIGIDRNGRVRLSPWPLAEPPGDGSQASASDLELVASVLESGAHARGSSVSSTTADLVARLRLRSSEDSSLMLQQLLGALASLGVSVSDRPKYEMEVTTATMPSQHLSHRMTLWPRLRRRWPLAVAAGIAALTALLAISLRSSNPSAPAAATTSTARMCNGKTKPCPALKSPFTASAVPKAPVALAIAPAAPPAIPSAARPAPPVGGSPATAPPASVATATTTTLPPSTTTTLPPLTTTTLPPSTTTTLPPSTTTTLPSSTTTTTTTTASP